MTIDNQPSTYQTKWVDEEPPVGQECPVCATAFLEQGKYGGILCRSCRVVFKKSKYSKSDKAKQFSTLEDTKHQEIMAEIKEVNERLNRLGVFLRDALEALKKE